MDKVNVGMINTNIIGSRHKLPKLFTAELIDILVNFVNILLLLFFQQNNGRKHNHRNSESHYPDSLLEICKVQTFIKNSTAGYSPYVLQDISPPNQRPKPSKEDTGLIIPANCITGIKVPIMTKNIEAIWLLVIVNANRPIPVAKITNKKKLRSEQRSYLLQVHQIK